MMIGNDDGVGKRKTILLLVVMLIVAAGYCMWWFSEPRYQGERLSYWMKAYNAHASREQRLKADEAVRKMGVNALPMLLEMFARTNDSAMVRHCNALLEKQSWIQYRFPRFQEQRAMSYYALHALGPEMKAGIPVLSRIINDEEFGSKAAILLAEIGPEGFKVLTNAVSSSDERLRWDAALGLAGYGRPGVFFSIKDRCPLSGAERLEEVIPVLIRCLQDPDSGVRRNALFSLGVIGADAHAVVPVLTKLLHDPDEEVKAAALAALGEFGKEARGVIPEIQPLVHENFGVGNAARDALMKIDPKALK